MRKYPMNKEDRSEFMLRLCCGHCNLSEVDPQTGRVFIVRQPDITKLYDHDIEHDVGEVDLDGKVFKGDHLKIDNHLIKMACDVVDSLTKLIDRVSHKPKKSYWDEISQRRKLPGIMLLSQDND